MLKDVVKQWYKRRKPDANCYVGDKFMDPVEHEENCQCTDADYEWWVRPFSFWKHMLIAIASATTTSSDKTINVFPPGLNVSLPTCALTPIRCTWDRLGTGRFPEIHAKAVYRRTKRLKRSARKRNLRKAAWSIRL
jgi:hypothetical protein